MNYELTIIISEKITEKELPEISDKIKKIISDKGGVIESVISLGRKKFTHLIKKNQFGTYFVFQFNSEKDQIKPITSQINSMPDILRFMITKINLPKEIKKIKKAKPETTDRKEIEKIKPDDVKIKTEEKKPFKLEAKKITKAKETKPKITREIESEEKRMEKLEEELGKILEE